MPSLSVTIITLNEAAHIGDTVASARWADEVVVVDDHITGVLSEHQAGRCLNIAPSGIAIRGRKSTPGRYFQVAQPGNGWGGTDISDPLSILDPWDAQVAWPGLRLLMTSTTGEHAAWFVLDEQLKPQPADMPDEVRTVVDRIGENCEPSLVSVLFLGICFCLPKSPRTMMGWACSSMP